jgi:hypothetical protein
MNRPGEYRDYRRTVSGDAGFFGAADDPLTNVGSD